MILTGTPPQTCRRWPGCGGTARTGRFIFTGVVNVCLVIISDEHAFVIICYLVKHITQRCHLNIEKDQNSIEVMDNFQFSMNISTRNQRQEVWYGLKRCNDLLV